MSSPGTRWPILAAVGIACASAAYLTLRSPPLPEVVPAPPASRPTRDVSDPLPAAWSTIKGRVVWQGPIPKPPEFEVRDPLGLASGDLRMVDESYQIHARNRGVKNAVVFLAGPPRTRSKRHPPPTHPSLRQAPTTEVTFDLGGFRITPRIITMREGQTLVGRRSGKEIHNINFENPLDQYGALLSTPPMRWTPQAVSQPMRLTCNVRYWMTGYVWVFDHPYFALTDENGAFEIPLAPCGDRRLVVWHESMHSYVDNRTPEGSVIEIKEQPENNLGEIGIGNPKR